MLMLYKIKFPDSFWLLRGNHECRQITLTYGFLDEICKKYGNPNPWGLFMDLFDYLPLGAIVDDEILCIHGGISPEIRTVEQIRAIQRNQEIPIEGPFCDLMWSDPENIQTWM